MFDQVVSFCGNTITARQIIEMWNIVDEEIYFKTTGLIKAKDIKGGLLFIDEFTREGHDSREFLNGLVEHFRNILVARVTGDTKLIETSEAYRKRYQDDSAVFSENDLLRLIKIAGDTAASLRWSQQPRLTLEVGMMQMIKMESSVQIDQLLHDLQALKKKVDGRSHDDLSALPVSTNEVPAHTTTRRHETSLQSGSRTDKPGAAPVRAESRQLHVQDKNAATFAPEPTTPVIHEMAAEYPSLQLSTDDARHRWSSFVDEARKHRIDLWSMLNETTFIDVRADRLRIECPDDFHMEALKRNRQFLSGLAQRVYGAKVILETMLAKEVPGRSESEEGLPQSPGQYSTPGENLKQHPVVQALMKEFGAVEVG
jgi:DNA polymerase-3 subunit gamma/tau